MIAIFDYGAGNLRSVQNTLAEIGAEYTLVRDADGLRQASKIILPGVGHFGQMMRALDQMQVREAFLERIEQTFDHEQHLFPYLTLLRGKETAAADIRWAEQALALRNR